MARNSTFQVERPNTDYQHPFVVVETQRCLVVPDVHQDIAWVERILSRESKYDSIVFLGDYFDTRTPRKRRTGVKATCSYFRELSQRLGDRVIFLLGNHDVQYLEAKPSCDRYRTPRNLFYKCGSAYSHAAAAKIAKAWPNEFWVRTRLFVVVNGWLLSHAGFSANLWPNEQTSAAGLVSLEQEATHALLTMKRGPHPFLQAGKARGGDAPLGGLTWLDWDEEFLDNLPYPQIVGHTPSDEGPRKKGRSWCLDGNQTCYGVISGNELLVNCA